MPFFASARERRLWLWTALVLVAIYSTLGLAGTFARYLSEHERGGLGVVFLSLLVGALAGGVWVSRSPGRREVGVAIGVASTYLAALLRMGGPAAERTHLFEYGVVALLIHQALSERARQGRSVPAPALLAVLAGALLGWLDEGIQWLLPNRVYELQDVAFNALAALLAVASSLALGRARRRDQAAE